MGLVFPVPGSPMWGLNPSLFREDFCICGIPPMGCCTRGVSSEPTMFCPPTCFNMSFTLYLWLWESQPQSCSVNSCSHSVYGRRGAQDSPTLPSWSFPYLYFFWLKNHSFWILHSSFMSDVVFSSGKHSRFSCLILVWVFYLVICFFCFDYGCAYAYSLYLSFLGFSEFLKS